MTRLLLKLTSFALAVTVLAVPAAADWLVTRDGSRIETDGPWEERGRLIVFTTASGDLASIRTSEVDLEASRAATEEALAPAAEAEPEEVAVREDPVLVLTDDDVRQVDPSEFIEDGEEEAGEEVEASAADLVVTSWQQLEPPAGGGVTIQGTLRNNGQAVATQVRVNVTVFDTEGESMGTEEAVLTSNTMGPGEAINFRALFPDVQTVDQATFAVTNNAFAADSGADEDGEGDDIEPAAVDDEPLEDEPAAE
ncbi:MAG: FxLYD domain-containing protein [Acidobacteriota bacterium]|nr:FxLYD domain-containing protein [Acidobacteriota bacterium]